MESKLTEQQLDGEQAAVAESLKTCAEFLDNLVKQPRFLRGNAVLEKSTIHQQARGVYNRALAFVTARLDGMGVYQAAAESRIEARDAEKYGSIRRLADGGRRQPRRMGKGERRQSATLTDTSAPVSGQSSEPSPEAEYDYSPSTHTERLSTQELLERVERSDRELKDLERDARRSVRQGDVVRGRAADSVEDLYKSVHEMHRWRAKRLAVRRRSFLIHSFLLAAFGLLVGVLVVNWLGDQIEDRLGNTLAAVAFAILSWVVLDYLIRPALELRLIRRQVMLLAKEAASAHICWILLRVRLHAYEDDDALPLFQSKSLESKT